MRNHTKLRAFELTDEIAVTEKVLNDLIRGLYLERVGGQENRNINIGRDGSRSQAQGV